MGQSYFNILPIFRQNSLVVSVFYGVIFSTRAVVSTNYSLLSSYANLIISTFTVAIGRLAIKSQCEIKQIVLL